MRQIIGSDFITLYGAGLAYRTDITQLYNLVDQYKLQQTLIEPTKLPGVNPFISPPNVAQAYSIFTFIPLPLAFILWSSLSLLFTLTAIYLNYSLLPESIKSKLSMGQLLVIVLSFFPFIEGFQVGQNHTLTFLLITIMIVFMLSDRWFLAGIMAGLMIYKPHLVIGFIVIWILWRKYKALGGFLITAFGWAGSLFLLHGIEPYKNYLSLSQDLFLLPYLPGFPGYLYTTLNGLLATIFPIKTYPIIFTLTVISAGVSLVGLGWLAFKVRKLPIISSTPVIVLAILIPIFLSPYTLLHDFLIIIPGFILWSRYSKSNGLMYTAIAVYLAGFFLTLLCVLTKVALFAFVSLGLIALTVYYILHIYKPIHASLENEMVVVD